jgi:hypothetical protein
MKIKKVVHHGKIRWRVNDPKDANRKRQRKFFETKEAAERLPGNNKQTVTLTGSILRKFRPASALVWGINWNVSAN